MSLDKKVISELQQEFDNYISSVTKTGISSDIELQSTGLSTLDALLGGGIGRFTLLVGSPGSLKSTLCGKIASQFQREHSDGLIVYIDTEHSMSPLRLEQLGLKGVIPKSNLTVEQVFNLIEAIVLFKQEKKKIDLPALVIWDSIANTPSKAELTAAEPKEVVGMKARVISLMLPKIMNLIDENNITVLAVNQLRDRIVIGYGAGSDLRHLGQSQDMPGGKALKFAATQLLDLKVTQSLDDETSPYGQRSTVVTCKTVKNKYFPDNYKTELLSLASTGFDDVLSNLLLLKKMKKVTMSAWSYLKNYPEKKFRIREIKTLYNTNPEFKKHYDISVKEAISEMKDKMVKFETVTATEETKDDSGKEKNQEESAKTEIKEQT